MTTRQPRPGQKAEGVGSSAEFIGAAEAAKELGVTAATLRRWVKERRIEGHKVGKQWRIRRNGLGRVIDLQETEPASARAPVAPGVAERGNRSVDALLNGIGLSKGEAKALLEKIESEACAYVQGSDPQARTLLAKLLVAVVHGRASDMHIEPWERCAKIRTRIDGMLMEAAELPRELARPLVREIMGWAKLDPARQQLPQDGRFTFDFEGRRIEVRVSTMPLIHGNVVALRILDPLHILPPLDRLGFEPDQLDRFERIIRQRNGLIVVTGPTGCGKTTTLYSVLSELNDPSQKIVTAEDPVEYDLHGIDQAAIRPDIGFDFSQAARAMLRQAPDVIFIGEIQNREVGEMLCKTALTGHLVFSTMHTNDAPSVPVRLMEMGVKPFLVASSLQCALAQRLVRLVCPSCKIEHRPDAKQLDALGIEGEDRDRTFYRGKGCKGCSMTGYRGRTAVYQLLDVNGNVREAIMNRASTAEIRSGGCGPIRQAALKKLFRGETTVEEVVRQMVPDKGPSS